MLSTERCEGGVVLPVTAGFSANGTGAANDGLAATIDATDAAAKNCRRLKPIVAFSIAQENCYPIHCMKYTPEVLLFRHEFQRV